MEEGLSCGVGAGGGVEVCEESSGGATAGWEALKSDAAEDCAMSAAGDVKAKARRASEVMTELENMLRCDTIGWVPVVDDIRYMYLLEPRFIQR